MVLDRKLGDVLDREGYLQANTGSSLVWRSQRLAEPSVVVVADTAEWPYADQTADFAYARLQGAPGKESYDAAEREARAGWLAAWADGRPAGAPQVVDGGAPAGPRDVFAFFVSTDKEHAPDNARAVMARLGLKGPGES